MSSPPGTRAEIGLPRIFDARRTEIPSGMFSAEACSASEKRMLFCANVTSCAFGPMMRNGLVAGRRRSVSTICAVASSIVRRSTATPAIIHRDGTRSGLDALLCLGSSGSKNVARLTAKMLPFCDRTVRAACHSLWCRRGKTHP